MRIVLAWLMLVSTAFADWGPLNRYEDFNRILVAGRVKALSHVASTGTNRTTVGAALQAAGGLTLPPDSLRVTVLPKAAFRAPTNDLGAVTGSASAPVMVQRPLCAGDTVLAHTQAPSSVKTNLQVLAIGAVKTEGVIVFDDPKTCTMMHLVFRLGGLPVYANPRSLRLIRITPSGRTSVRLFNAQRILQGGDPKHDLTLQDGDVVVFPRRQITLF